VPNYTLYQEDVTVNGGIAPGILNVCTLVLNVVTSTLRMETALSSEGLVLIKVHGAKSNMTATLKRATV
jgi:hypothetical protein